MARHDAPMGLAHVYGADAHREAARGGLVHDVLADLLDELFLDLKPRREVADDAVVFGQADDLALHGGQHPDIGVAVDRHEVVRAGGPQFDRPRDDQLVVALGVLELGDLGGAVKRPRSVSSTNILATRDGVSRVLWSFRWSMRRTSNNSSILRAAKAVMAALSDSSIGPSTASLQRRARFKR